jgi:L-lactate dehydrogenase complex protein LldG
VDRDAFLARVGKAVMTDHLPEPPRVSERLPDLGQVDLVALFRERAIDIDAVVHGPMSRHGVPKAVVGIAAGHDADTFVSWDDLPAPGVATALTTAGLERLDHVVPNEGRLDHQLGYYSLDLGITGADAGLAESGSVVLTHGAGRPRLASLAPDIHIALLEVSALERTLAHWAHRHSEEASETTNLVIVSGPSRTGDIEQQLNLGVHGPRHVHIVLLK